MTQKEVATLEKLFIEIRELSHKVQNIEDAILGSDYYGKGIKHITEQNERRIDKIENRFKHFYYFLIGFGLTGTYTLLDLIKKAIPALF
jgi:hypothetical protein